LSWKIVFKRWKIVSGRLNNGYRMKIQPLKKMKTTKTIIFKRKEAKLFELFTMTMSLKS